MKATVRLSILGLSLALATSHAVAQQRPVESTNSSPSDSQEGDRLTVEQRRTFVEPNTSGRTALSSAGQTGQRQTRDTAAQQAGIEPLARISNRVQNRVQNRIRNRIDRNYIPLANATDPFVVAEDQASAGGRRP